MNPADVHARQIYDTARKSAGSVIAYKDGEEIKVEPALGIMALLVFLHVPDAVIGVYDNKTPLAWIIEDLGEA